MCSYFHKDSSISLAYNSNRAGQTCCDMVTALIQRENTEMGNRNQTWGFPCDVPLALEGKTAPSCRGALGSSAWPLAAGLAVSGAPS